MRDLAYEQILHAIVEGSLAPGERLNDQELADWLGISRTPVREALARLERGGLVETRPGKSTSVTEIDQDRVLQVVRVASALHGQAMNDGFARLDADAIARMRRQNELFREAMEAHDATAALDADSAFHAVALEAARNPVIEEVLEQVLPVLSRAEHMHFGSVLAQGSYAAHAAIIDAVEAGDRQAAVRAVQGNWQSILRER